MENRDQLSLAPAATQGHDLIGVVEIHAYHRDGRPENLGKKGDGEVLLQHGEESHALFGLAICVDNRFFNQGLALTRSEPTPRAPLRRAFRGYAATWHRKVSAQPLGVSW